jgi:hypothetical protein
MLDQSSTGRTYTRNAYAPVRRDAHAEVEKINGRLHTSAFPLIPSLKRSNSWQMLYCRPGGDPFVSLASVLMPHLEPRQDEISRAAQLPKLRDLLAGGQLCYLLRQVVAANGSRALLLFIDQFESSIPTAVLRLFGTVFWILF